MRYIADLNVLLPLLADGHSHRAAALEWWEGCADSDVGLCLPVQMGLLRLLSNASVMGKDILRPEPAWDAVSKLTNDPRVNTIERTPPEHAE